MGSPILQVPTSAVMMFFCFLVFFYFLLQWRRSRKDTKLNKKRVTAPEAAGAWPIIGHLHLLGGKSLPHITLGEMADKYGPAFIIKLGMQPALVISSWEVAKECFTTNDKALATRNKKLATKIMGYDYAIWAFTYYGNYWRDIRKISMLELLSARRIEMFHQVRGAEVGASIRDIYTRWGLEQKRNNPAVLVDMKRWFADLTLNIIAQMVAGKRYFGPGMTAAEEEEGLILQKGVQEFFHYMGLFVLSDAFPILEGWDLQGYEKAMKNTADNLDAIADKWLKERRQKRLSADYFKARGDQQDFLDTMISLMEESKISTPSYDIDTVVKASCLTMILGGNDTTSVTFTWALSLLLNHPHVLKKAQEELDFHIGKDREVQETDVPKLEYLQAIVKETLRLYPAAPIAAHHEAIEECTIAGFHIPVGTRIVPNLYKLHRDPRVWPEPLAFQPQRFLANGTHADIDLRGHNFEFIPFGSGRRMCPGLHFALYILHLGLARLLHGFDFATPSNEPVDLTESPGLTNVKASPLDLLLSPRLSPKLYE